jgi:hypothetical protein
MGERVDWARPTVATPARPLLALVAQAANARHAQR